MLYRIVPILVVVVILFLSWRLMVRPSRLVIKSDQVHFPTVSGFNLDRQEVEFPRDFEGDLNLLFVPFLQAQQAIVNTWIPFAQELEASFPRLAYYELPTIEEFSTLSRTLLNEGMRAGIPDPKARQRTITLYINLGKFMQATEIPGKEEVHILLVDRQGKILWRTTGNLDQEKGDSLVKIIQALLATGP